MHLVVFERLDHSDLDSDLLLHPEGFLDLEALFVDQTMRHHHVWDRQQA